MSTKQYHPCGYLAVLLKTSGENTRGHRGAGNRCSSCGLGLHQQRKIKPHFHFSPHRPLLGMVGRAAIICDGLCPSVWMVNLEITPIPWSSPALPALLMLTRTSIDIIFSPGPTLKNVRLAYTQKHSRQNVPLTWLKGKNLKHLSDGESFGCS